MKVLYLGMKIVGQPRTGGEYGQLRNREMLKALFKETDIIEIPRNNKFVHAVNIIFGRTYGYTKKMKRVLLNSINKRYDLVFVDSSACGGYVQLFNEHNVKTVVFCHNVEYEYYKAKYESEKTFLNRLLYPYFYKQEKLSMKYATRVITLNQRDSDGIYAFYGRKSDFELPVFYEAIDKNILCNNKSDDKYLLFVGADFFANTDGVIWFIRNVSKHIHYKLYIAGGCCNTVSKAISISDYPNVVLLGFVDDLDKLYKNAYGVICPIFSGSGMKTKTIEALKYGKFIFGTNEAFEGITTDYELIGGLCNNSDEFIEKINNSSLCIFNEKSYDLFLSTFSTKSVYPKLYNFVCELCANE